jgi:hypothetical protein
VFVASQRCVAFKLPFAAMRPRDQLPAWMLDWHQEAEQMHQARIEDPKAGRYPGD